MSKRRVVNFGLCWDVEVTVNSRGFFLEFYGETTKGNEIKVKIPFEFWWVRKIASCLWTVVEYQRKELDRNIEALKDRDNGR